MADTVFDVMLTLAHRLGRFSEGIATAAGGASLQDATFTQAANYWKDGTIFVQTTDGTTVCKQSRKIISSTATGIFAYATISPLPTTGATFTVIHKRVPRSVMLEALNTAIKASRQNRATKRVE
jgi:hypothetical protein